jgi:3-hydroxyacyl-CoA dehydrogenase/enoyl-CoA hydratase/carnithine racemase
MHGRLVVAPEHEKREGCRIAPDRRLGLPRTELERPSRVLLRSVPVIREEERLHRADRAAPAPGRRVREALAVDLRGSVQPLGSFVSIALHQECKPGSPGGIPHSRELLLPRVRVAQIGEARLSIAESTDLALDVLRPVAHDSDDNLPAVAEPVTQFALDRVDTVALVTMDDGSGPSRPNVFGRAALESLARLLPELEHGDFSALVITGKTGSFSGGADVKEFPRIERREQAIEGSRAGHDLFGRIRALPYPSVAAINGGILGGGVELALHCDYRVMADDVRHFASPECLLGFVPAWGATQLAPRIAGPEAAVKLIALNPMRQNKMLNAAQAHELGFVDRVVVPERLIDEAMTIASEQPLREEADLSDLAEAVAKGRRQLDDSLHGAAPAPYRALDLIEGAATWSLEEGYRAEEEALADLLLTPEAQASLYAFDLVERRARRGAGRPAAEPREVTKVGIAGAGLMATQLATLFLRRLGVQVVLRDLEQEIVDQALETIRDDLSAAASRGRLDPQQAVSLAALAKGTTSYEGFEDCDFAIEAIFEELDVKRQVFGELEDVVPAHCVLATNTSALSVTAMAEGLEHPERLLGMHFFNPVALMPLVELIRTPETDDVSLATGWSVADRLRKRPVLVNDAPGFVVNRLLARMMVVLLDEIERGNTVEETDEAVLGLGLPMAPSVLLQMVGEQVANHVRETLRAAYPDRFAITGDGPVRSVDEIREAVLAALADEVRHMLEEGVVESPKDVDTALILGAGFPFFMGGLTPRLDQAGYSYEMSSSREPSGSRK